MRAALHRAAICLFVGASVAGVPLRAQMQADRGPQTFRSSVDVVTIQASVRDTRGRTLAGLSAADFEVRDNGQMRPVLSLRSERQSPLTLGIVVDTSGSMRLGVSTEMARYAYESLLGQLRDGRDAVGLFTFDSSLHVRQDFTTSLVTMNRALDDFQSFGTTALYDATAAAARRLAARSGTHKAILLFTDGIDTSSTLTAAAVSGLASSIDVPVYVIATVPSMEDRLAMQRTRRSTRSETADLRDLAEWTGGELVFASTRGETSLAIARLIGELRQQYVIAIEAANTREWRRLDVRVRRPALRVKARSGYYGG